MTPRLWLIYCYCVLEGAGGALLEAQSDGLSNNRPPPLRGGTRRFLAAAENQSTVGAPARQGESAATGAGEQPGALATPFGELFVPFGGLVARGMKLLITAVQQQHMPLSQSDLDAITSSIGELAAFSNRANGDVAGSGLLPSLRGSETRGVSFLAPSDSNKRLSSAAPPVVLVGMDSERPRFIKGDPQAVLSAPKEYSALAQAVAKIGLASVVTDMTDEDFQESQRLVDTTQTRDVLSVTDQSTAPETIKQVMVKQLLSSTSDTLPWLPLDGIVATLPGFLVNRMGKTGELLGTLAGYWKTGAETIDNVAGGLLKPILNNIGEGEEEDYTGKNGFVENVNVPDEDVSIKKKIITGAGIPTKNDYGEDYLRYLTPAEITHGVVVPRRGLSAVEPLVSLTQDSFADDAGNVWHRQKYSSSWRNTEHFDTLSKPKYVEELFSMPTRHDVETEVDDLLYASSEDFAWESRGLPGDSVEGTHGELLHSLLEKVRRVSSGAGQGESDRLLNKQLLSKKLAHSREEFADGPLTILRDFVRKQHQQTMGRIKTGSLSSESKAVERERLLVGDDFDDEDEIYNDDDDFKSHKSAGHHAAARKRLMKQQREPHSAPARELQSVEDDAREFLQAGGGLLGRVISTFIGEPPSLFGNSATMPAPASAQDAAPAISDAQSMYSNLKSAVERQKIQLDTYLEQMASIYKVPGPAAEAQSALAQEETRRNELVDEVSKRISNQFEASLRERQASWDADRQKLWDELEREKQRVEKIKEEAQVASGNNEPEIAPDESLAVANDLDGPGEGAADAPEPVSEAPRVDQDPAAEHPEFYEVVAPDQRLVTVKDFIDQMFGSLQKISSAPTPNQAAQSRRRRLHDDDEEERSLGPAPYEAKVVPDALTQIVPTSDYKALAGIDWSDIQEEWSSIRDNLVSQIASSVGDVSQTVNHNPLSEIVQSVIQGLVDSNPLAAGAETLTDGDLSAATPLNEATSANEDGIQDRIAQSAASMLRQISQNVIKSGPRIKPSAAELDLKQPDPDPVKKNAWSNNWWFY